MIKKHIGTLLSGSLSEGFAMRINASADLETIKAGKFVCIAGNSYRFFSLITDMQLNVSHPDILQFPPTPHETLLQTCLMAKNMYATAILRPMLMLGLDNTVLPVKTIPPHFAPVFEVDRADVARIFGDEKEPSKKYFSIGSPLDMHETSVCIDLEKFTERSSGVFGKTGTGKTFITRLLLAGLIHHNKAVTLIFDMHSEYGLQARKEGEGASFVKGLKTLFSDKVVIFSLDPASTRRRGGTPDVELSIPYHAIAVEDIISLQSELALHPTACEAAYLIAARYKQHWLQTLLMQADRLKEFAAEVGAHPESVAALYRKLKTIERLPFLQAQGQDTIDHLISCLDSGRSVIIEFGNYTSSFCYLLVANIITRRIHREYTQKTERFLGSHNKQHEPKKLLIVIEEAHKFLNPQASHQTIFGTIAREMRKYYVSLLIVDQRPSGIDSEVLSQIGTKLIAQLNDEKDIQAVLCGSNGSQTLRSILSSLDSKKQALILGHAVTMPIVIETRSYDEKFYKDLLSIEHKNVNQLINEMF